jgi:molybdenum cofactor biosynthesis enzyme MoaA
LQYAGEEAPLSEHTISAVMDSSARHVAIVGKEPLVDSASIRTTERLVRECALAGKTVSLITNGIGLHRLSSEGVQLLEWIDVSLDGGPQTYAGYRRGNFDRILENVRSAIERGARSINALHTVSSVNVLNINDMMAVRFLADWDRFIFSPYAEVRNDGVNPTATIPFSKFLQALAESEAFRRDTDAFVLIGSGRGGGRSQESVIAAVRDAGLVDKVMRVDHDPLLLGYVRLTYDGYVLTPYQSLHPADYREYAIDLAQYASVDAAFEHLRAA